MQFSKDLLAQIHIKLDTEGLNSLSEKEVIVLLAEQNRDTTESFAKQVQDSTEFLAKQIQNSTESLAEQNRDSTESLAKQIQGSTESLAEQIQDGNEQIHGIRKTQDEILKEISQSRQILFGMLQTQDRMLQTQENMLQEMYQSRQAQEKWQQAQERWQQTQESKIDKLIYWAKWVIAAGGAVAASVLANLIWEAVIKR